MIRILFFINVWFTLIGPILLPKFFDPAIILINILTFTITILHLEYNIVKILCLNILLPSYAIIIYILISVFNCRAEYDPSIAVFHFNEYIKLLPTTFDSKTTTFSALSITSVILSSLGFLIYGLEDSKIRANSCKTFPKYCIKLLQITFFLIVIIGLVDWLVGGIIHAPAQYNKSQPFSLFGYGGNACAVLFCGLAISSQCLSKWEYPYKFLLIIGILASHSRLGIVVCFVYGLFELLKTKTSFIKLLTIIIFSLVCFFSIYINNLNKNEFFVIEHNKKGVKGILIDFEVSNLQINKNLDIFSLGNSKYKRDSSIIFDISLLNEELIFSYLNKLRNIRSEIKVNVLNQIKKKSKIRLEIINERLLLNDGEDIIAIIKFSEVFAQLNKPFDTLPHLKITKRFSNSWKNEFKLRGLKILYNSNANTFEYPRSLLDLDSINKISSNRINIYRDAIALTKMSPYFGYGFGCYHQVVLLVKKPRTIRQYWVHSDILEFIIELGIIGCLVCLIFIYSTVKGICRYYPKIPNLLAVFKKFWMICAMAAFDFPLHYIVTFQITLLCIISFLSFKFSTFSTNSRKQRSS